MICSQLFQMVAYVYDSPTQMLFLLIISPVNIPPIVYPLFNKK